jgi:hypothetical protein
VSDSACGSTSNVAIAVKSAHSDEVGSRECAEQAFTRLIELIEAGLPVSYQLLYELKAIPDSFSSQPVHVWLKCRYGHDMKRYRHKAYIHCRSLELPIRCLRLHELRPIPRSADRA